MRTLTIAVALSPILISCSSTSPDSRSSEVAGASADPQSSFEVSIEPLPTDQVSRDELRAKLETESPIPFSTLPTDANEACRATVAYFDDLGSVDASEIATYQYEVEQMVSAVRLQPDFLEVSGSRQTAIIDGMRDASDGSC